MVADALVTLRERSVAVYVSVAAGFVVDRTMKPTQPPVMVCGVELCSVVACAAPPVLEVKTRLIESVADVTVLPAASLRHTVIVEVETPLAGIGFGDAAAVRWLAAPNPAKEIVAVADVSVPDVAVASQLSATESLSVNLTVVPVEGVLPVAGLPAPPVGVVLTVVAEQSVAVLGR
jgi:hypothetical protein